MAACLFKSNRSLARSKEINFSTEEYRLCFNLNLCLKRYHHKHQTNYRYWNVKVNDNRIDFQTKSKFISNLFWWILETFYTQRTCLPSTTTCYKRCQHSGCFLYFYFMFFVFLYNFENNSRKQQRTPIHYSLMLCFVPRKFEGKCQRKKIKEKKT